ncbi:conserved Plasmodium protein, unknown function [Plasmodium ovale]|uniref:Mon2/Sec7/BIG1-like dimerisation and cyclophilin-binding domain-containing protein n=1 Tax=Plasmodium ovale TaxID=36330 RepID=A0A1C3KW89_PLAOA|nr:conserved Plasmodium protein, unknown function [Plasmodium ovale]
MNPPSVLEELENDLKLLIAETKKKNICIKEKTEISIIKIKNYNSIIISSKNHLLNNFEFPLEEIIEIVDVGINIGSHRITCICLTTIQRLLFYILYLIDNKDVIKNFKEINIEKEIEKITNKLFDLTFIEDKKILIKILQIILTAFSPQYIQYYNKDIINTLLKILYSIYYSSLYDNNLILYQTCCAAYKQLLNSLIDVCNKEELVNQSEHINGGKQKWPVDQEKRKRKGNRSGRNGDERKGSKHCRSNDRLKESGVDNCKDGQKESSGDHSNDVNIYFENFDLHYNTDDPIDLIYVNGTNRNNMQNKNKLLSLIHYLCYCCFVNIRSKYYMDSTTSYECGPANEEKEKKKNKDSNPNMENSKNRVKSKQNGRSDQLRSWDENCKDEYQTGVVKPEEKELADIREKKGINAKQPSSGKGVKAKNDNAPDGTKSIYNNRASNKDDSKNCGSDKHGSEGCTPSGGIELTSCTQEGDPSGVNPLNKSNFVHGEHFCKRRNSKKDAYGNIYSLKSSNIKNLLKILKSTNSKNGNENRNNTEFNEIIHMDSVTLKTDILSSYNKNNLILPLNFCLDLLYIFLNNYEYFLGDFEFFKLLKFEIVYIILISLKYNLHIDIFYRCLKIFKIVCHKYFQYFLGEIKFLFLMLMQYLCLSKPFSKLYIVLNFFFYLFDDTRTLFHLYKYFYCERNNKKSVSSVSSTELEDEPSKGTKKTRKTRKKTEKMAEKRKGLNILGGECSNSLNANGLEGTITCKEDILHSIKSYRNIKDGVVNAVIGHKIEGNKDDDTDRDRPVSNEKKIYTNKKQSSEKKIERKLNHSYVKNDMKEETNLNYKEEYYKDRDDFVFIKIVEYISKIIHELLFLHSIDITKMYIHLKVFKYDRICTTERIRDQLVDKARCKYSNNDTDEGEKYLVEKKQCVGENSPFRKTDRCDEKILEERKIKKEENEISFCNFLSYPLILPNNSINPREDFYLFKYSSEKRVNKILFDDLCYKDADEIRLLASSIDSILSLINSYYVIFLNILKKSFNQYCFATIDLNEEKNTPQIDSLRNSINNQENENYIQEGEIAKLPSKSACGHMSVRKFELENENDNECLDFDYEVNRRIERCCIENVADKHNKLKDRGGSRSGSGSSSDSSSNRSSGSRSNVGLVEGKGEKRCSSYRRKSNSYDEHISLFCYVFNSTCRYFISSLCLIFSYTNTLDACFFNGFQKLIFMSTHLKINICTNACLQTLTKCSSIFTLENSPFFLKILRNFEKQGNKNDSNTSLKKNKTGSKTSKVVMTYSSSERKNVFSQRSETNSINNNVTITVESKGNPVCTENTPEQVKKNSNEHVHTLNDTRKESQSGNDLNKDSNFMGNVTACTAEQESNVYSCKGRCTNNESNDSLLGRNKQTYANLKCETKKGKTSNFTGSTSLVTTFVLDSNGENENNILNSCTVADAYRGNDVSNVVELEKKGNDTNMDALDDLCDETSDSEEDDVHDYAENCKSKEPTSGECGGSIFRGGEVPSSVGATSDKNSYAGRESFSKRMSIESVEANFISCKPALNENLLTYFDDVISIILKESYYINNDLNNVKYILSIKTVISIFYIFGDNLHFENWLKLINLFVEINYIYKYISSIENKTIEFLNFLHHINKNEDEFTFSLNKCLIDPDKNTYLQNVNSKSIEFCYFILRFIQKNPVLCAEITVIFSSFSHFFKNTVFYNMSTLINILNSIHFMIFNQFFKQKKFMRKDYDKLVHMDCNPRGYPIYTSLHASAEKVNVGNTAFNGSSLNAIKFSSERAYDKDSTTMKRGKEGSEKWGKDKVYNDNSAEAIVAKVAGRGHGGNASGNEHCCSGKEKTKNADKISQSEDCMQRRSNHFSKSNKKKSIIEKYIHFVRKNGDIFVIFYYYLAHFDPVYTAYFTFYSDMFFLKNGIVKEEEKRMKCSKGVISPEGCSNLQHIDIEEDKGKLEKDVNYRKCNKVKDDFYIALKRLEKCCIFEDFYPLYMIEMLCVINMKRITYIYNNCCINILLLSLCKNKDIQKKSIDTLFNIIKESFSHYKHNFEIQFLLFKPFFFFIVNPYVCYRAYFIISFLNFIRKNSSFFNKGMWLFIIFLLYISFKKELKKKSLKKIHIGENNNKIDEENITNINNLFNILEIIIVDYIEEIPVCKIMEIIIHMLILFSSLNILSNNISFRAINFSWSVVDYIINRADMLKENISNAKIQEKKRYFENKKKGNVKLLHVCVVENKKIYIYENDIKMKNIKMKSFFIFILNHLMKLCFDERIEVRNCSIKTIISILSTHICKFDFFFYKTSICLLLKRLTMKYYYKLQEYFKLENNNAQRVHSIELTCSLGNEMGQSNNSKEPDDRYSEEDNYKQQSNYAERSNSGGHAEQGNHKQPHGCSIKVNEHNPYATECKEIKESVYTSINGRNMVKTAEDVNFECFNGDNDFKCWLVKPQVRDREKCNRDYLREEFRNSFINLTKEQQEEATKKKKKCSKNEKQTEKKKMHKLQKAHKTKDGADLVREVEEIVALPNVSGDKVLEEDKNGDLYNYVNENFSKIIIHHSRDSKLKQWIESFILIIEGCNRILLEQKNYKKFYVFYDIFVNILRTILFIEYNKKNMFELHISILQILNNIFMSKLTYFDVFYFTTKNSVMRKNRCTDYINIFDKCFYYLYNYAYYVTDQKIKDFIIKLIAENLKNIHCHKWVYLHSLMYLHLFNLLFSSNSDIVVSGEEKGNFSFLNYDSVLNKLFFDYFVDNAQGNERRNAESEEEGIYENENEEIEDTQMDNEEKRIDKRDNTERADEHEASEEDRNNKRENTERVEEHKAIEEDRTNERENTERMDEKKTSEEDEVMCSADESMIERKSQVFNREGKLSFKDSHFTFEYKTNNSSIDPLNIYNILENSKEVYNVKNIVMYPNLKKKNIHKIYLSGDINSDIFIIVMQIFQTLECDKINLLINEELLKSMNILLHHLSENKEKRSIYTKLVNFIFNDKILFNENSEEIIDKIELNDTYNKLEMNVNNNELNEENKECNRLFTLNYKKLYPLNNYMEIFQMFSLSLFNYFTPCYIFSIHNKFNLYPNYNMNFIFSIILCNLFRQEYCSLYYMKENIHLILSFINMFPYIIATHVKCFLHNLNNNSSFIFYESIIILLKITYNIIQNIDNIPEHSLYKYWYSVVFAIEKILFVNCSNDKIDMLDIMLIKFIRNSYLVESSRPPLFIKIYLTKIISELNDRKRRAFSSWTLQILFEEYEKMAAENYKDRYYTTFITLVMLKKCVLTLKSFSNENNENADEVLFILYEMKKLKCYYSHIDMQSSSILKCSEDKAHLFICYPYLLDCLNTKNKKVFTTVKELLKLIPIML